MTAPTSNQINFTPTSPDGTPAWIDDYVRRFDTRSSEEKFAILDMFNRYTQRLPLSAQQIIYDTAIGGIKNNVGEDELDLWNMALVALQNCPDFKKESIKLLASCLDHPQWFIRGNAAYSLARLGVDSPELINRIGDLIFDHDGHHWSAGSAAIEALEILGSKANSEIPKLLRLTSTWLENDYFGICSHYEGSQIVTNCFSAIGNDSPEVIDVLRRMAERQLDYSYHACIALGYLGKASLPAIPAISAYLCNDDMPAYNAERTHALLDTLTSITEKDDPVIIDCLQHLLNSPFEEVAKIARSRLELLRC